MKTRKSLFQMIENNQGKKYVDHVNISIDKERHMEDRQKSGTSFFHIIIKSKNIGIKTLARSWL